MKATQRGKLLGWSSLVIGLAVLLIGHLATGGWNPRCLFEESYQSFAFALFAIAGTVLIVDRLNEARAKEQSIENLIRDLSGNSNSIAVRAARQLRQEGKLHDGALSGRDLSSSNLKDATLDRLVAENARLAGCQLSGADLSSAVLCNSNMNRAVLQNTVLEGADLRGCSMVEAVLVGADLAGCDLRGADLSGANCEGADFQGANLLGCILDDARISEEQLKTCALVGR